jgi:hypothetical protein
MNTSEQVYIFNKLSDPNEKHFSRGHTKKYAPIFTEKEWAEIRRLNKIKTNEKANNFNTDNISL